MKRNAKDERMERYRNLLSPEMAEVAASQDEAIDDVQMPNISGMDLDKWSAENEAALAAFDEDEEDAKWMAKQKG